MIQITATFLDEVSSDIPHQNWGFREWDRDFAAMKAMGIDTVVMIRSGLQKFIAYPSRILVHELGCYEPYADLVDMFLTLAEKHDMKYMFGTYALRRNGDYEDVDFEKTWDTERRLLDEVWERYGHRKAFAGWYLSKEIGDAENLKIVEEFIRYSQYCKNISGGMPTLISPAMLGRKCWPAGHPDAHDLDVASHERAWDQIMGMISGHVDVIAFQDGHVTLEELREVLKVNKRLADKHGIDLWTNCESFDRDMPFRFPPIKWEKMWHKLRAAREAGITNAITFEFSHFMSPHSMWKTAGNLYDRYLEFVAKQKEEENVVTAK